MTDPHEAFFSTPHENTAPCCMNRNIIQWIIITVPIIPTVLSQSQNYLKIPTAYIWPILRLSKGLPREFVMRILNARMHHASTYCLAC